MLRFAFWNICKNGLEDKLVSLVNERQIDVLILAESQLDRNVFLNKLNLGTAGFSSPTVNCRKIQLFTRFDASFVEPRLDEARYSFQRIKLPGRQDFLLVMVHLPSKLNYAAKSQHTSCRKLARLIREEEEMVGHRRTVVVGDFNVNPFEDGFVETEGMHAVMSKSVAAKLSRQVEGANYPFFYNPMWRHFGSHTNARPAGTYYLSKAEHLVYFWNMFDQVLVRPELLNGFSDEELQIVTDIGGVALLRRDGTIDTSHSDHLPITFSIQF
jgi:hypothetical protein